MFHLRPYCPTQSLRACGQNLPRRPHSPTTAHSSHRRRVAVAAAGSGIWIPHRTREHSPCGLGTSLMAGDTTTWCAGGWRPVAHSCPLSCWALGSLVQKGVRKWELEALQVELEEEWSWTQEHHCCSTTTLQLIQA